ncbi:DNA polymerase [Bosea sp. NBC_00550]|uniref:DNA polymerase n=1 Tax=Bosea sp. NBC_00550 TaxID=2969621 RepID=UPI00222F02FB|nr:DNA polymerase [Bosea sp. NBC_00550]UZF90649.1 DNA polymerase [Bosea sp. NBC_00550]
MDRPSSEWPIPPTAAGGPAHPESPRPASALSRFVARLSYATDAVAAAALVAEITADAGGGLIAVDFETAPLPSERARFSDLRLRVAEAEGKVRAHTERRAAARRGAGGASAASASVEDPQGAAQALALAKAGLAALTSARDHAERAGLDPHRSTVRLCSLYAGGARVGVIDMTCVNWAVLAPVWEHPIVMHNATFDLGYLAQRQIEPVGVHCTLQATRLLNGPDSTSLETAAATYFGLEISKALQTSDWGAPHLTLPQVEYAATDAVVTWHLARVVLPLLGERRAAYDIQVGAIPAVVRMQLRGILLDVPAHAALVAALKAERAQLVGAYDRECVQAGRMDLRRAGVPENAPEVEALLNTLLPEQEREAWPRTPSSDKLSARRVDLTAGAGAHPLLQILVAIGRIDKQLSTYGERLAAQVSPVTGRIHASYRIAGAISGRSTCDKPNMQNVPDKQPVDGLPSFRTLFVAKPGYVLVAGDWSSMEMRAAACITNEENMTEAFARGEDLHVLTARTMLGLGEDEWLALPEETRALHRKHAKPVNFGRLYGQGARGLVDSARAQYGLLLDPETARGWIDAYEGTYPGYPRWCRDFSRACERKGEIPIGREGGRVHEIHWNPEGFRYTQCLNLPIQGACADAFMLALAAIDEALFAAGIDGGPVAAPHDEFVLEVAKADAARTAVILKEAMTAAFAVTFPGAPLHDLVVVKIGRSWAETK